MKKLSLGCGKVQRPGFIGLDIEKFGWNIVWDATKDRIPFNDNEVDFIEAHNFIEHIERKYWKHLFNECWRVLNPRGTLEIIVPNVAKSIDIALADPTHVSFWVNGTVRYLTGERPRNADYGFKRWYEVICIPHQKDERSTFLQLRPNK